MAKGTVDKAAAAVKRETGKRWCTAGWHWTTLDGQTKRMSNGQTRFVCSAHVAELVQRKKGGKP